MAIQQAPLREHYDSEEAYQIELDAYLSEIERQINSGEIGAGAGDVGVVTGTDDQDRPTVGDLVLGYRFRFLHTRYATSADGNTGFTNDYTTITDPSSVYQGLRNSASNVESTNPADYTWRELSVVSGWRPSYRTVGGRQIDWMFTTVTPDSFTLDDGSVVIDLDSLPGAIGADGSTQGTVTIFQRSSTVPSTPQPTTDYNSADGSFTLPSGWTLTVPSGDDRLYSSTANVFGTGTLTLTWQIPVVVSAIDGINVATAVLYQRTTTNTAPAVPATDVTYTFTTGIAAGIGDWLQNIPPLSQGEYLWTTEAVASSRGSSDIIPTAEWSTPVQISVPVVRSQVLNLYQRTASETAPGDPGQTSYTLSLIHI